MYLNLRVPTFCRVFVFTSTGEEAAMVPPHLIFATIFAAFYSASLSCLRSTTKNCTAEYRLPQAHEDQNQQHCTHISMNATAAQSNGIKTKWTPGCGKENTC